MKTYLEMLTYKRPAFSKTEDLFIDKFLMPLGCYKDNCGNVIKTVGNNPNILWSSHTDTVHIEDGFQEVIVTDAIAHLPDRSQSNCLGADCTTGVFIMYHMIKNNIPGLYIFHRSEERGGIGSNYIATKTPEVLNGIDIAIAFDRYGYNSIITHQIDRCCSEEFSKSLSALIPRLKSDSTGIFTDTANYTHIVPECTNLSVGYFNQHTSKEYQDLQFLYNFIKEIVSLDTSSLVVNRVPQLDNDLGYYWDDSYFNKGMSLLEAIKEYPESTASLLESFGFNVKDILEEESLYSNYYYKKEN